MNEFKQITRHLCLVYRAVRNAPGWLSVAEVVKATKLPPRTVRALLKNLSDAGVFTAYSSHGGYRYKLMPALQPSAKELTARIHIAESLFGVTSDD